MSGKSHQQSSTTVSTPESQSSGASQNSPDNSVMQKKVTEQNKVQQFLDKYTNPEALTGYAENAVSGLSSSAGDLLKQHVDGDPAVADQLASALDGELKRVVRKLMMDTGVAETLSENQTLMVLGALAAATSYIMKNSDLPTLKKKFKLGDGHGLDVGVGIGKTLDLALEKIDVKYRYRQENFNASIGGQYKLGQDGLSDSWSLNAGMSADLGGFDGYTRGNYRDDGSWDATAGIRGGEDNFSWNVEGFTGEDQFGQQDSGVRAGLSWKF